MRTITDKERMINDIIQNSRFYNNPKELRIREFKSIEFIHKMVTAPKSKFICHFSQSRQALMNTLIKQ